MCDFRLFDLASRTVLLGVLVAAILLVSLIIGIYAFSPREMVPIVPSQSGTLASSSTTNTLASFGVQTFAIPVGAAPYGAYNPEDGDTFVAVSRANTVVILNNQRVVVGNVKVGGASSDLLGIAYSPADQRMYVTSYSDSRVYIVNGSEVTGSIGGFNEPIGISFSTSSPEMFVANSGNDTVTASWNGLSSTDKVGSDPREVVFDPSIGAIVVTNYGEVTLSVVSA